MDLSNRTCNDRVNNRRRRSIEIRETRHSVEKWTSFLYAVYTQLVFPCWQIKCNEQATEMKFHWKFRLLFFILFSIHLMGNHRGELNSFEQSTYPWISICCSWKIVWSIINRLITPPIISFVLFVAFSEWILSLFACALVYCLFLSLIRWISISVVELNSFLSRFSIEKRWISIMKKNSTIFSIWMQYVWIFFSLSLARSLAFIHDQIFSSFFQVKHQARFATNTIHTSSSLPPRLPLPSV